MTAQLRTSFCSRLVYVCFFFFFFVMHSNTYKSYFSCIIYSNSEVVLSLPLFQSSLQVLGLGLGSVLALGFCFSRQLCTSIPLCGVLLYKIYFVVTSYNPFVVFVSA
jgi:hypothetical protein